MTFLIGCVVSPNATATEGRARVIDCQFDQKTGFWQLLVFVQDTGRLASWRADNCYLLAAPVAAPVAPPGAAS